MKGHTMIGTLARKRTNWRLSHLTALAVIAALVAAMFVATTSSQSATHKIVSTTDTDFLIADGGSITVQVEAIAAAGTPVDAYVFGEIFGFVLTGGSATDSTATYRHQAGGPTGEFTITAKNAEQSVTQKLIVGDAGTNLATVNLHLSHTDVAGTSRGATPRAATDVDEKDTSALGTAIFIHAEALNSLGEKSNVLGTPATANLSVTVFAVGGAVTSDDSIGTTTSATGTSATFGTNTVNFAVTRATAGAVRVFAIATISGETVQSDDLNLTFTATPGDPANVSLSDGGTVAQGGAMVDGAGGATMVAATQASLPVSATDTAGVDATIVAGTTVITSTVKGPDGKDVAADNGFSAIALAVLTADIDPKTTGNQPGIVVTLPADAAPGVYTVESTLGTSKDTATFTVTGPPTNVEVEIAADDGTGLGAQITATATVTDTNGNLVAPTDVAFTVGTGSPATFVGVDKKTKDGVASRNAVITGAGVVTVIATSGGVSGVAVIRASETAVVVEESEALVVDSVELSHIDAEFSAGDSVVITATVKDQNDDYVADGTMVTFTSHGGGTRLSPATVATSDGMASVEYINLTDDLYVQAYSSPVRSDTLRVMVESEAEEAARLAAEQAEADRIAAEEEAQRLADEEAERQRMADEEAERQRMADEEAQRLADEEAERQRQEAERQAAEEAERQAQEERDAQILASIRAELAAAAAAQDAASAAQAAANAAEAAAAAETAADAQAAADMAKAYADKAQAAANSASDESETAGTDAAQASADAAAASAEAAQESADAAQASADATAQDEADAKAEAERIAAEEAKRQAEADRQQEIQDAIDAALEAERQRLADEEAERQRQEAERQAEEEAERQRQAEEEAARQAAEEAARLAMPAAVSISSSPDDLADGSVVTVTISVTDHNGEPVADGTTVSVALGGSLGLNAVTVGTGTIDGAVTAVYIVDGSEGSATIVATAGEAVGTATLTIEAPAPPPAPEPAPEVASLDCFSNLVGFSTWTCGVDSTASEAFALVAGRGATAIHLWNGSAWVRYAIVDGNEVPGSSDFMIAEDDILYISN